MLTLSPWCALPIDVGQALLTTQRPETMKRIGLVLLAMTQTGCIVAGGGYGSRGGWFIWPGGLGGLLLILLLFFFLRRGR